MNFYEQVIATGIVPVVVLNRVEDAVPLAESSQCGLSLVIWGK